jgi:hypothetical protein
MIDRATQADSLLHTGPDPVGPSIQGMFSRTSAPCWLETTHGEEPATPSKKLDPEPAQIQASSAFVWDLGTMAPIRCGASSTYLVFQVDPDSQAPVATIKASTPVSSVGCRTGRKRGLWLVGISLSRLSAFAFA